MSGQPNKIYCEDCKTDIPKFVRPIQIWSKHIYCQRHLRAKAARMFYALRKKQDPHKRQKTDEEEPDVPSRYVDYQDAMGGPSEVSKSEAVSSKAKPAGVWCVLVDLATDLKYFKNRISGKTQRNKPVGLKEEDLDVEYIDTVEEKAEVETEPVDPESIARLGQWEEVKSSYFFGEEPGSDEEQPEDAEEAVTGQPFSEGEETYSSGEEDDEETLQPNLDFDLLETTEHLKTQAEEEPIELVEKPVYEREMQTSATFTRRSKKPRLQL